MSDLRAAVVGICAEIAKHRDELCRLDATTGDGDHGVTMSKAATLTIKAVNSDAELSVPEVLQRAGTTVVNEVGGAMGPVLGSALLAAGRTGAQTASLDGSAIAAMLASAAAAVRSTGKVEPGDKTMLDALMPAAESAQATAARRASARDVLQSAVRSATQGADDTADLTARAGRASRLGERTRGHQDAGATSVALILTAIDRAWETEREDL